MIDVKMKVAKDFFFDRERVKGAVDEATRAALGEAGSMVMTKARDLIRSGKKPSKPDKPPKNHTGLLREKIIFMFSPESKSVLIGPTLVAFKRDLENGDSIPTNGQPVPHLLEFGGEFKMKEIKVLTVRWKGKKEKISHSWVRHRRSLAGRYPDAPVRTLTCKIEKRPYMKPALENKQAQFSRKLAQAISKSFRESRHKYGT